MKNRRMLGIGMLYRFSLSILLLMAVVGCESSNSAIDGDFAEDGDIAADGDILADGDEFLPDGDQEPDSDEKVDGDAFEAEGEDEIEQGPLNLFEEHWWPMPDESGITELLDISPFFASREKLILEMSSWFEVTEYEEPGTTPIDSSELGYYGVGNGTVFGLVGANHPRNTIHGMLGPGYQKHGQGFFSDFRALLLADDKLLPWKRDHIWKLRQGQVTMTRMQVDRSPVELDTLTFAPPDIEGNELREAAETCIVQLLNVRNTGTENAEGISLRLQSYSPSDTMNDEEVFLEQDRDDLRLRVRPADPSSWSLLERGEDGRPGLQSVEFELEAGAERQFVVVYEFADVREDGSTTIGVAYEAVQVEGWEALLSSTIEWWTDFHQAGMRINTEDRRVDDMLATLLGAIRLQIARTGALVPMSRYTSAWMRDSYAPMRSLYKFGHDGEARRILDYMYYGSVQKGRISNSQWADKEYETLPDEPDWYANIPFSDRERGEGPSYYPLMFDALYRYGGEPNLLVERWDFIMHTLMGQGITDEVDRLGLMYFSGDETFRIQLASNLGLEGGVNYLFEDLCYSANSAFLFTAAAEAMLRYARETDLDRADDILWLEEKAQLVRQATENFYWFEDEGYYSPFIYMDSMEQETSPTADINTKPLWTGYLQADDPQARSNIEESVALIGQDNGILQIIPPEPINFLGYDVGGGLMTGMSPAYFLYNTAELDLINGDQIFDTVGSYVSASGNASEVGIFPQPGKPFTPLYFRNGGTGEMFSRYRPWEGAILVEALMHYLIGLEADLPAGLLSLSPHLPHASAIVSADNILGGTDGFSFEFFCDQSSCGFSFQIEELKGLSRCELEFLFPFGTVAGMEIDSDQNLLKEDEIWYDLGELSDGRKRLRVELPLKTGNWGIGFSGSAE